MTESIVLIERQMTKTLTGISLPRDLFIGHIVERIGSHRVTGDEVAAVLDRYIAEGKVEDAPKKGIRFTKAHLDALYAERCS